MIDNSRLIDIERVAARVVELMGGRDQLIASIETEYDAMKIRWNKDVEMIGRILRAHLHVEYYLTEFLQYTNQNLGNLDEARITFNQKINLLPHDDRKIFFLIPGIRHLNKIRNRLAHNLDATVTENDAAVFLQGLFKAFRDEGARKEKRQLNSTPIDILEEFAEFSSSMLHAPTAPHSVAFAQAIREQSHKAD